MRSRLSLGIKNKFPLIDLARYGTLARKNIHPDLLIGNYPIGHNQFKEGDILDANAVWDLILCNNDALGVTQMNDRLKAAERGLRETNEAVDDALDQQRENTRNIESLTESSQDHTDRITSLEEGGAAASEAIDALEEAVDNLSKYKHVFMTQDRYDALTEYDANTIYFIWDGDDEPEPIDDGKWHFPGTFPIVLDPGGFPYEFPIRLT